MMITIDSENVCTFNKKKNLTLLECLWNIIQTSVHVCARAEYALQIKCDLL